MADLTTAVLVGGAYDGQTAILDDDVQSIEINGLIYDRINDPDTGESLGGYALRQGD